MPIEITEQLVSAMAPAEKAVLDGRGLIKKGAFRALARTADNTLVFADCQGSGSTPYRVSVDLDTGGDRPTVRCSCPSRQHPCKHGLGLMLAFLARGNDFKVAEAPGELLAKRTKLVEKNQKVAEGGEAAKPRTVNKAAQAKKTEQQRDALDALETFTLDLVSAGLGGLDSKRVKALDEQARRMADADLQGARGLLLRLASVVGGGNDPDDDDDEDDAAARRASPMSEGERHARVAALVTQIWVTVRRGRKVLEGKLEEGEARSESDAQVESLLGRRWQLTELKEAGYWITDRVLVELAHERADDPVLEMAVATGYLLDLGDGAIHMEQTALPHAALNAGGRLRVSRTGTVHVKNAALYPGETLNRRVRWDEKSVDAVAERPRTSEQYAQLRSHARALDPAIKSFRDQLKNPLAPTSAVVLLSAASFGLTAQGELVMVDPAGARLVMRDPREAKYPSTPNLRHAAGAYGPGGLLATRLWFEPRERAIYGQPLALIVGETHLRLGM